MRKVSILSLLLAAFLMALCFTACSNGNNPSDNNNTNNTSNTIVFVSQQSMGVVYKTFFYADKKYKMTSAVNSYAEEIESQGTYTGDPSKDGKVIITQLKASVNHNLVDDINHTQTELNIINGQFTVPRGEVYTRQ